MILCHGETPDTGKKTVNALDARGTPRFAMFQRSHEHFVEPQGIRPVFGDNLIGVDHIPTAFGHFLSIVTEDHSLVHESLEWLGCGQMAEIKKHLMPEAGIQKMEHGVFGSPDIQINTSGSPLTSHPILLGLGADEAILVLGIAEAKVVPAGTSPLGHGIELALCSLGIAHPFACLGKRWFRSTRWFEIFHFWWLHREFLMGKSPVGTILPNDREGFPPVTLTGEKPVTQLVRNRTLPETLFLKPCDDFCFGF